MKIENLLVTTDFSPESRRCFPVAGRIARRFGARIHLVHFLERLPAEMYLGVEGGQLCFNADEYVTRMRGLLKSLAGEEAEWRGLPVETHALEACDLQDCLPEFERTHAIDLVLISSRGRGAIRHFFLGSFTERVVKLSACPVLTYRPRADETGGDARRRLLVPHDFSERSRLVLDTVRFLAASYRAQVRLIHVLERPETPPPYRGTAAEKETDERPADARERARRALESVVKAEFPGSEGFDVAVAAGDPATEIVREARAIGAHGILMSTHGWTKLRHILLGTVAERVVRHAPCPVLTVRPPGVTFEPL